MLNRVLFYFKHQHSAFRKQDSEEMSKAVAAGMQEAVIWRLSRPKSQPETKIIRKINKRALMQSGLEEGKLMRRRSFGFVHSAKEHLRYMQTRSAQIDASVEKPVSVKEELDHTAEELIFVPLMECSITDSVYDLVQSFTLATDDDRASFLRKESVTNPGKFKATAPVLIINFLRKLLLQCDVVSSSELTKLQGVLDGIWMPSPTLVPESVAEVLKSDCNTLIEIILGGYLLNANAWESAETFRSLRTFVSVRWDTAAKTVMQLLIAAKLAPVRTSKVVGV